MSPPPQYESFAGISLLVLGLLVVLARASQAMIPRESPDESREPTRTPETGAARIERRIEGVEPGEGTWGDDRAEVDSRESASKEHAPSSGELLVNVALTQGVFGAVLVGAAWFAAIPPGALGVELGDPWSVGVPAAALGVGLGVALYALDEIGALAADAFGVDYAEGLREHLAPDSAVGWAVLLGLVLPTIAGFEELLFRAALIGALATGFGVPPWLLAGVSTGAFALGHGAQGPGGILVTGLLGFALAAAFILTGSLLVVVVAHYLVNALEFAIHEGLDVDWG